MILSGLRVFDIRDPYHPREIAYFNAARRPATRRRPEHCAMSSPAFVPERGEIWYSDGYSGFYALRLTNGVWQRLRRAAIDPRDSSPDRLRAPQATIACAAGAAPTGSPAGPGTTRCAAGGAATGCGAAVGRDVIRAARGSRDRIDCGTGRDEVFVDAAKDRWRHCETVHRRH